MGRELRSGAGVLALAAGMLAGAPARADVTISSAATQNMSCSGGVCAPTSPDAVLNAGDLETLLASGNVEVTTAGSGVQADNIDVTAAVSWSGSGALTLDAYQSVTVDAAMSVESLAGLTLTTDDGGTGGALSFGSAGNVSFADPGSSLTIDGAAYMLVDTIQALASAIAANPSGNYAFASSFDARQDGTYKTVPVPTTFTGTFEGLGNTISHLKISDSKDFDVGLFSEIGYGGTVRDIGLAGAHVASVGIPTSIGALAATSFGLVSGSHVSGAVEAENVPRQGVVTIGGLVGLVGISTSTVEGSYATASITVSGNGAGVAGGLVGVSGGSIENSFATGNVTSLGHHSLAGGLVGMSAGGNDNVTSLGHHSLAGGLVGMSAGGNDSASINIAYATGNVTGGENSWAGGLVGEWEEDVPITNTYATGAVSVGLGHRPHHRGNWSAAGGLIGLSESPVYTSYSTGAARGPGGQPTCDDEGEYTCVGGSLGWEGAAVSDVYWDITSSGNDNASGRGTGAGITGLTTKQLKSGLPAGFDPSVWGQQQDIHHGLPYLLAIPPKD